MHIHRREPRAHLFGVEESGILLGRYAVIPREAGDGTSPLFTLLRESLCPDPDVEFVVTFGSQVTGDARPSSDLDIAVKFAEALSPHERFRKLCFLSGDLQPSGAPFIDISDIEELPLHVAHDAINGEFPCGDEEAFRPLRADTEAVFGERRDDIRSHQTGRDRPHRGERPAWLTNGPSRKSSNRSSSTTAN